MTTRAERKSKGKRGNWTVTDLELAMNSVRQKTSGLNAAAKAYHIPKATLKRHLDNANKVANGSKKILGRQADLPDEIEDQLVQHVLNMEARFYGLSTQSLRKLAFQIATINAIPHRFNKEKQEAGKEWLTGFLKRHREISIRTPEPTSLARASGFNKQRVYAFFDLLEKLIDEHGFTPDRIYNTDEKGLTAVQKPGKILAKKGKSQVGSIISAEKGKNVTFVCTMSAAGHFIPPMAVFPRKRWKLELETGAPPGTLFKCQEKGWMTIELFSEWMKHFISFAKPDKNRKVLLILDGHVSHTQNLEAIELAREAGVIMLSLPSHTTHRIQPLDVAFFRPLSIYYSQEIDKWMREHAGRAVSQFQVCQLFGKAYARAASLETAANGFRASGIWPVNRHVFDDFDFAPSEVSNKIPPRDTSEGKTNDHLPDNVAHINPTHCATVQQNTSVSEESTSEHVAQQNIPIPASQKMFSVKDVSPLPHCVQRSLRKRKGNVSDATVLTSTRFKNAVAEKQKQKRAKLDIQQRRKEERMTKKAQKETLTQKTTEPKRRAAPRVSVGTSPGTSGEGTAVNQVTEPTFCAFCGDSTEEDWIRCGKCCSWVHEACANITDPIHYYCDDCCT